MVHAPLADISQTHQKDTDHEARRNYALHGHNQNLAPRTEGCECSASGTGLVPHSF